MSERQRQLIIILLMVPISGAAVDIYAPSLPAIAHYFNAHNNLVQLTIPVYLIAYSVSQVFIGAITDSFGRRTPLIAGLALFSIASALAPFTNHIYALMIVRIIQGITVATAAVITRAIVTDTYKKEELPKIFNYFTITWALGPICAPVIGGYLQEYIGWQAPFVFLALYGLVLLILVMSFLPETIQQRHPFKLHSILNNFKITLSHTTFLGYVGTMALMYALLMFFNIIGPFLIQTKLHYSPIIFGKVALTLGVAWFLGGVTNRFFIRYAPISTIIYISQIISLLTALLMLLLSLMGVMNLASILIPTLIIALAGAVTFTNSFGLGMSIFPHMAGAASSVLGTLFVGGASIAGVIATMLPDNNQTPLALSFAIIAVIVLFIHRKIYR